MMIGKVYLSGLKPLLKRYGNSRKRSIRQGDWEIWREGSDLLSWELRYEGRPVVKCDNGALGNVQLTGPMYDDVVAEIKKVYPMLKVRPAFVGEGAEPAMGKVVKSGSVSVMKPFSVRWFDDDDGWKTLNIRPGEYEYRVLDVNGWKPRQLKIDGAWEDVAGDCEELEDLLMKNDRSANETTTVSSIAPTVDYVGHVVPVEYLGGEHVGYGDDYDKPNSEYPDDKDKDKDKDEEDWVSPIGRLIAGESVRSVVGSMAGLNEAVWADADKDIYDDLRYDDHTQYAANECLEEYEDLVDKFKKAADSRAALASYGGSLCVKDEPLKKGFRDPDGTQYWVFKVYDEDLNSMWDELKSRYRDLIDVPPKMVLNCDVSIDNDASVKKASDLVASYADTGKSALKLFADLEEIPGVGGVVFDWDTDYER